MPYTASDMIRVMQQQFDLAAEAEHSPARPHTSLFATIRRVLAR